MAWSRSSSKFLNGQGKVWPLQEQRNTYSVVTFDCSRNRYFSASKRNRGRGRLRKSGRTSQAMQRGGRSGRSRWACEGWESSEGCGGFFCSPGWHPQVCFVRLGRVHGGPHLSDSTREAHILACKSTPFAKLPLFLEFSKQEQPGAPL